MRRLLALVALVALAAAPARDWTRAVTRTPAGATLIGNPAARVKLVEYLSYTCPHCAHFTQESATTLRGAFVRSGSTSVEVRHFVIGGALDLSATVLARCAGPRFAVASDAIFARQEDWIRRGSDYAQANADKLKALPTPQVLRLLADGSGLTELVRAAVRLTPKSVDTCFANKIDLDRVIAMTDAASKTVPGTPGFAINGVFLGTTNWAALQPQLRAAGAR